MDNKNKLRVIIVEDEILTAMFLKKILEDLGCNVLDIITTGEEAVELAKSSNPDIIFLDIILEGKIDGIDTAIKLHDFINIPFVYTTGCSDEVTIDRAFRTCPLGCIFKPYTKNMLRNVLSTIYETKKCATTINM